MKNKVVGTLVVMAITLVAAFNIQISVEKNDLSFLYMENVEAQAADEIGSLKYNKEDRDCVNSFCYINASGQRICNKTAGKETVCLKGHAACAIRPCS